MMKQYTLEEVLEEVCRRDFAEFDNPPKHRFSIRHRRNMKRIFSQKREKLATAKIKLTPKSAVIVVLLIFLALLTGAIIVLRLPGFSGTVYPDNTQMFTLDNSAPTTIEQIYYLEALPDNYILAEEYGDIGDDYIQRVYINRQSGDSLIFMQYTKKRYHKHYENERHIFTAITVNECNGFIWISSKTNSSLKSIVWDFGDYILEISGKFAENDLINLAKSAKILQN